LIAKTALLGDVDGLQIGGLEKHDGVLHLTRAIIGAR
jgi:hypothetical protein